MFLVTARIVNVQRIVVAIVIVVVTARIVLVIVLVIVVVTARIVLVIVLVTVVSFNESAEL